MKTVVTKRRSLTPMAGMPPVSPGAHALRRGTARKEMTERVTLRAVGGAIYEGWALNGSSGGLRAILDTDARADSRPGAEAMAEADAKAEAIAKVHARSKTNAKGKRVALGSEVQVVVGEGMAAVARRARIVWLQEEPDGVVVGLEFMSVSGLHRGLAPSAPAGAEVIMETKPKDQSGEPEKSAAKPAQKPGEKSDGEKAPEKTPESAPFSEHLQRPETD